MSRKRASTPRTPRAARLRTSESRPSSARTSGSRVAKPASRRAAKKPSARASSKVVARAGAVTVTEIEELESLRRELERAASRPPFRWNADADDVQRSVAHLVLTLIEFIRKLLERQAIRRMEGRTLTDQQTEEVGRALMKLEETVADIAARFGISLDELNLDLGPVGKLM